MKQPFAILRFAKLATIQNVASSGRHNWRERETPNADPDRTKHNQSIGAKDAAELVAAVKARAALATETPTHAPVQAIEVLATASPEWWREASREQQGEFFKRAVDWVRKTFGRENVVSLTAHHDETSPHLVAYVVPLVDVPGQTRKRSVIAGTNADGTKRRETREFKTEAGRRLSASHWLDGREKLSQLQTGFAAEMQPLGLRRGLEKSRAKHQSIRSYYARVNALQRPLPGVETPTPRPMPPKPPKPGLFASKEDRQRWEAWEAEAGRRSRQKRQHDAQRLAQGAEAVKLVRDLEPKAREYEALKDQHEVLKGNLSRIEQRAGAFERRTAKAEAVVGLFTPAEIEAAQARKVEQEAAARAEQQRQQAVAREAERRTQERQFQALRPQQQERQRPEAGPIARTRSREPDDGPSGP